MTAWVVVLLSRTRDAAPLAAAGVALGRPELTVAAAPGGALAGALTEEGVHLVRSAWEDRAQRVSRFAETAAKESGSPIEDLMQAASADRRLRELLTRAVEASTEAPDDWKIDVLARAFVAGARDGGRVDEMLIFVDHASRLSVAQVRLLAAIVRAGLASEDGKKDLRSVVEEDPGLLEPLHMLLYDLERHGLVRHDGEVRLTALGDYLGHQLRELGHGLPRRQRQS